MRYGWQLFLAFVSVTSLVVSFQTSSTRTFAGRALAVLFGTTDHSNLPSTALLQSSPQLSRPSREGESRRSPSAVKNLSLSLTKPVDLEVNGPFLGCREIDEMKILRPLGHGCVSLVSEARWRGKRVVLKRPNTVYNCAPLQARRRQFRNLMLWGRQA
eukprot:RCo013081